MWMLISDDRRNGQGDTYSELDRNSQRGSSGGPRQGRARIS